MPPVEPSADMRVGAHTVREMYVALLEQGFTENQSLTIIGTMLGVSTANQQGDKDE